MNLRKSKVSACLARAPAGWEGGKGTSFIVRRKTAAMKMRAKLHDIRGKLRERLRDPLRSVGE